MSTDTSGALDIIQLSFQVIDSHMREASDTVRYSRSWSYPANATAQPLVKIVLDNGLVPSYMQKHHSGVRNTLEGGMPTVRNKLGGHGQDKDARKVADYFAGYALHLAATNIVFLVEAYNALDSPEEEQS